MRMPKLISILAGLSLLMTLLTFVPAQADTPVSPRITLNSPQGGNPGSIVQVMGYSFASYTAVSFSLGPAGGQLHKVTVVNADSKGSFKAILIIPINAKAGDKLTVQAAGDSSDPIALDFVVSKVSAGYQGIAGSPSNMPSLFYTGPDSTYTYGYGYDVYYNSLINLPPYSRAPNNPNFNEKNSWVILKACKGVLTNCFY